MFISLTQVQGGNWLVNFIYVYLQLCFTRTDSYPSQRMGECKIGPGAGGFQPVCAHGCLESLSAAKWPSSLID